VMGMLTVYSWINVREMTVNMLTLKILSVSLR